jgi:hypothetical protein
MVAAPFSTKGWRRVSRRAHCPICDRHDSACLIFDNGDVLCQHVTSDEPEDAFLGIGSWHRARTSKRPLAWSARTPAPATTRPALGDVATCHAVYTALFDLCPLSDAHRAQHSLTDSQARRYGTVPRDPTVRRQLIDALLRLFTRDQLLTVPGFVERNGHIELRMAGMILPSRDVQGRIVAIDVRRETPAPTEGKYYKASSRTETAPDAPSPGTPAHLAMPAGGVRIAHEIGITEGVKKGDAAADALGYPVIALAGIGCTSDAIALLARIAEDYPDVMTVTLMLDRDDPRKNDGRIVADVERAGRKMAAAAVEYGLAARVAVWDHHDGKGIDDLLVAGKTFTLERYRPASGLAITADEASTDGTAPLIDAATRELIATQRAELADWKAQAKAWEHLVINRAIPEKAKFVLVHMHKHAGVVVGRRLPDDMPCDQYPDEQDIKAEGIGVSAYKEGLDILLSLDLLTRKEVKKKELAPVPGANEKDSVGVKPKKFRGKDWFWVYGLNGPAVNALWPQLPSMTEIAPTERQLKAVESRKERLEEAIAQEKPTPEVVRALKREVAEVRQDRANVVFEYRAVTSERDNARAEAEAAARERDRALQDAQRIIREHQRPPMMLACMGCGTRIDLATWRCDDCREREREATCDSRLTFNLESPILPVNVTNRLTSNIKDTDLRPCVGGCGAETPHGWACKPCRTGITASLHIHDRTSSHDGGAL